MLGTSNSNTKYAVQHKLNFSLSLFHGLTPTLPSPQIILDLKEEFLITNGFLPKINIALSVFCSDDSFKIEQEKETRRNVLLNVIGCPSECKKQINNLAEMYGVDEIIILNLGKTQEERIFLIENIM